MSVEHNPGLTSSELATLWNTYLADSLAICVLKHFLATNETMDFKTIIEFAISISKSHMEDITSLFESENIPIPHGFNDNDVNLHAPKLWSDTSYIRYLQHMGRTGLSTYGLAKAISSRKDIRALYKKYYSQTEELYDMVSDTQLEKGVYIRSPYISYPTSIEYVKDNSFLGSLFGQKRPLLAVEIAHLGTNIEVNNVGKTLFLGFSQVAQSQKLRDFFRKGYEIGKKQVDTFLDVLRENDTAYPSTWDGTLTESTETPFSDKLMLFHANMLGAIGIADYGTALSASIRKDLSVHYLRLMSEIASYTEDGATLLIKNGWFEKPPISIDRKQLRDGPRES
ncbi:DUF3231 family protein [Sutcliffiella halmapala]|uniref:DUF3231 family protein n=1 Tax=Sutcliffiella halmapala TaxID=79882 RepID=UPI000994C2C4|nr:DUF3231 family protein [Sutcliffiella halmapala]